jgi:hypothetical protein
MRASGVSSALASTTSSAPNRRASSSRAGSRSMTMTRPAPMSRAAAAFRPSPPAPCRTIVSPKRRLDWRMPWMTCDSAQLAGATTSSDSSSGTLKT